MLNLNAMFNTSCDVFDTRERDNEVNNKSLDADYLLNDLSSSLNAISSQFSAVMSSHNRISDMYSYIKLYGVDRACVQVYNRDGLLTDLSNGVVPATEDYCESNVSKYTIACMEGLGEAIIKILKWCWEKLKAIGKWIGEKVIAAFNWILSLFKSEKKKEMTIGEAIEELAKVKAEAKAKIDEIIKRSNASSSSNKITGVEDISSSYNEREKFWASQIMDVGRDIIFAIEVNTQLNRDRIKKNLKKISEFTAAVDRYSGDADDDSKFEEAYKRASGEAGGRAGEHFEMTDQKEQIKKLTDKLKIIASNPLRFADFNDLKNSFKKQCSLRSQFEDVMTEAKSLAEQTSEQLNALVERADVVAKKIKGTPSEDALEWGRRHYKWHDLGHGPNTKLYEPASPKEKEYVKNTKVLEGINHEISALQTNADAVNQIVRVATGMTRWFKTNYSEYGDVIDTLAKEMKNKKDE